MKTIHFNRKLRLITLLAYLLLASSLFSQSEQVAPLLKKARDHLNLFHYDQARALLKQAIQIDPNNWETYFLAGKSFLKQKKEAEAEKYLKKANDLNPEDLDCQKALGAVYIFLAKQSQQEGKSSEMVDYLHKACKAYPGGTKIWETLFENWWKSGDFEKIMQEGDFVVKTNKRMLEQGDDKNLQQALVYIAKCHYQKNDFPGTDKYLKYAGMIRQTNEELYSLKRELKAKSEGAARQLIDEAKSAMEAGEFEKALEIISRAEKTSNSSEIQEIVDKIQKETGVQKFLKDADDLRKANKQEEALEKLEEASMQFPEDERIANLLAVVSKAVEKIHNEQAEKDAKVIAEKKRRLEIAQKLRFFVKEGKDYEDKKKYDIAIISYEKALKITPANNDLKKKIENLKNLSAKQKERQNNYAIAKTDIENLVSSGDFAEAFEKGKSAIAEFEEGKLEISLILAEVCLKLEKYDEAKDFAIAFESSEENSLLYNYIRGIVAFNAGDNDVALDYLKKVNEKKASFRPDVNSTIWKIYISKFQIGIYIFLGILLFPLVRFLKESIANFKQSSRLRKVERIRESGEYEANLAFLEERFEKDDCPNPRQVAVMLAEALLRTGNPQRAYELSSNVIKKEAKNLHAKRIAGEACLLLEDSSPAAMEHIQNLYKLDESRKDVVEYLARTYMRMQADHKLAQDFILKFISLNPGDAEATIFLADTYIKRQTYSQQSQKTLERAVKIAPDVPQYYAALIQNLRKLENHDEARKISEIARSKFPLEPDFMEGNERAAASGTGKIGLKKTSPGAFPDYENIGNPPTPSSAGGFPDYENIGNPPPAQNAGGFPDYENIGNPQPTQNPGGFPDYENIGNLQPTQNPGGFPDYDNIGDETPLPPMKQPVQAPAHVPPQVSGPGKTCPHCQANNSVKEYYCTTCGKPL